MNITLFEQAQSSIELYGVILCVLAIHIIIKHRIINRSTNNLIFLLFIASLNLLFDAFSYIFRGNVDNFSLFMTRFANAGVFITNCLTIMAITSFIVNYLSEQEVVVEKKLVFLIHSLNLLNMVQVLVNFFTNHMYYFDSDNYYHRNNGWYVYSAISFICILFIAFFVIKCRNNISKDIFTLLIAISLIPIIMLVIQVQFYGYSFLALGLAICLILLVIFYYIKWFSSKEYFIQNLSARHSINYTILALMVLSMCASISLCISFLVRINNTNSKNESTIVAEMIENTVLDQLIKPITTSETMAEDYNLKKYLRESGTDAHKYEKDIANYLNSIYTGFGYQMAFASSEASKAYYTYDGFSRIMDISDPDDFWYSKFISHGKDKHYELNVDSDKDNSRVLSVFVNKGIVDDDGTFLGICGVGVIMKDVEDKLSELHSKYDIEVKLVDENGLILLSDGSNTTGTYYSLVEKTDLDAKTSTDFSYVENPDTIDLIEYVDELGLYLVVTQNNNKRIELEYILIPSIIIFLIGLVIYIATYLSLNRRVDNVSKELQISQHTSMTDELTGLNNRFAFENDIKTLSDNNSSSAVNIIMLDVNGLKTVNDTIGHDAGDTLLISAASCLNKTFREYGKIYRTGGDEFVVFTASDRKTLEERINVLQYECELFTEFGKNSLSISKGIAIASENPELNMKELIKVADKAMYADKNDYYRRTGKDRRVTW